MRFLRAFVVLCLCVSATGADGSGCSFVTQTSAATSPGSLDVEITADDKDDPIDGEIPVHMLFRLDGKIAEFAAGETVTCNGVSLTYAGLFGYSGSVPQVAPGGAYEFVYTRKGTAIKILLTAPERPRFTSPLTGTRVQRSNNLRITYVAAGDESIVGYAGDSTTGQEGSAQPDSGTYTGLDVTKLKAGPGSIGLIRKIVGTPLRTGFKSAHTTYRVSSSIDITWF